MSAGNEEKLRLQEERDGKVPWKKWGPYLSERQWGTVREDYSEGGDAWNFFTHDHARSRAYRWGEDGIAGISDDRQRLCFSLALWNGKDPILKERLFGLTNSEGNHGEDVKEYYFYLDSTPTHSYMKYLYKYPQKAYPYSDLVETNSRRSRQEKEYELLDTGVFNEDRHFDVFVEYAKEGGKRRCVREGGPESRYGKEMKTWPKHPVIYEINTWVWLGELSRKYGKSVELSTVPEQEWDAIAAHGFDAVWFMGVWERSPFGIGIAMQNQGLLEDFRRALPDLSARDVVGSPYCVKSYVVDGHLGGTEGLAAARTILRERGLRLILDYVPNHIAPDHPWVFDHPEYFIRGDAESLRRDPASFFEVGGNVFACGRDPYFPAWPDVLQLNAFQPGLRQAVITTISEVAGQCDGIRCDMAMLMLNTIFERTWGARAGEKPVNDYWTTVIPATKTKWPEFRFIAEAYWDLEWELQQQGFDYCYDKKLYDRMEHGDAESVRQHLLADSSYQQGMVRFIENHDEPRAAATFPEGKGRAAAVAVLTLTGAKLLHEGQFEGMKVRLPVFLGRRPAEPIDHDLADFYGRLLKETNSDVFRNGEWRLCKPSGWPDNQSCQNILSWCWVKDEERYLIVINFGKGTAQARVHVQWDELRGKNWRLIDLLSGESYDRSRDEMRDYGLYVDLGAWKCHLFQVRAL